MTIRHFKTRVVLFPLFLVSVTAVLISLGFRAGFNKSDWASWIQAVGSIVAIIGAFGVASYQHEKEKARQRQIDIDDEIRRLHIVSHIAHRASFAVFGARTRWNEHPDEPMVRPILKEMRDSHTVLSSLAPFDLPTAYAVGYLYSAIQNMAHLIARFEDVAIAGAVNAEDLDRINRMLPAAEGQLDELAKLCNTEVSKRQQGV